jgi:hypothetical protein
MGSQTNRLPDMRPAPQRRFIPVQDYPVRPPVLSRHFLHDGEGSVGRSVIRKDDFNRPFIILPEYAPDGIPDAMLLIMPGQDNADGRESRRIHEKKCRKGSEKNERNIALPRLHIRHHVHTGFPIRCQCKYLKREPIGQKYFYYYSNEKKNMRMNLIITFLLLNICC